MNYFSRMTMTLAALVVLVALAVPALADCTTTTSGNVTLWQCVANSDTDHDPNALLYHFFVSSSDPNTKGFRLTITTTDPAIGTQTTVAYTAKPNGTAHTTAVVEFSYDNTSGMITRITPITVTVDELQATATTVFAPTPGAGSVAQR